MFANGATLKFGSTKTVTELTNITFGGYDADDLDTTTHNSTTKFRTFEKGLTDAGVIDFEGFGDQDDIDILEPLATTTTIQSVTITIPTIPSVTKFEANGFINSFEVGAPHDDLISVSGSIKISGKPTYSKV